MSLVITKSLTFVRKQTFVANKKHRTNRVVGFYHSPNEQGEKEGNKLNFKNMSHVSLLKNIYIFTVTL